MTLDELWASFREWRKATVETTLSLCNRSWCNLGLAKSPSREAVAEHFKRDKLNADFLRKYEQRDLRAKEVSAYDQFQISMIYSMQKSFVVRNKSRMQTYRDDCAQKKYFLPTGLNIATAYYRHEKEMAERPDNQTTTV